MIDTKVRSNVQLLFDWSARVFWLVKLHPNTITVFAFVFGIISGLLIINNEYMFALLFILISGYLDIIDGTVARLTNKSSKLGGYLDLIFDRLVEAFIVLAFYLAFNDYPIVYMLFYIGVIFNFSTFMLASSIFDNKGNKIMHYDIGLVERSETFITFILMLLFVDYSVYVLLFFIILMFITGLIRLFRIIRFSITSG